VSDDQDFFFEDEPQAPKPSGKGSKSAAPAASKPKAPAAKTASAKAAPATATPVTDLDESASFADQSTTWAVASLVGVCGLLLGLILGFMLGTTLAKNAAATAAVATPAVTATTPSAVSGGGSTLTTAQLQSGQLPAGHPAISTPATTTK